MKSNRLIPKIAFICFSLAMVLMVFAPTLAKLGVIISDEAFCVIGVLALVSAIMGFKSGFPDLPPLTLFDILRHGLGGGGYPSSASTRDRDRFSDQDGNILSPSDTTSFTDSRD